ncbi:hypothetical protein HBB16_03775 [Pseudonocardia sp. MCCB 268]|nr:hypothetical protein [Pseudonocardia cytotoxica]
MRKLMIASFVEPFDGDRRHARARHRSSGSRCRPRRPVRAGSLARPLAGSLLRAYRLENAGSAMGDRPARYGDLPTSVALAAVGESLGAPTATSTRSSRA